MSYRIEKNRLFLNNIHDVPDSRSQKPGVKIEKGFLKKIKSFFQMTVAIEIDGDKLKLNKSSLKKYVARHSGKPAAASPKPQEKLTTKRTRELFESLMQGRAGSGAQTPVPVIDSKAILKYFPEGFGTDTSRIQISPADKSTVAFQDHYDLLLKIQFIGSSGCGINKLLTRIKTGSYQEVSDHADFIVHNRSCKKKEQSQEEEKKIKFQLFGTGCSSTSLDKKMFLTTGRLRGVTAVALAFDLTKPLNDRSHLHELENYISEIQSHGGNQLSIILVGTKVDALENDPDAKAKLLAMEKFAKLKNFYYCTTSAKDEAGSLQFLKLTAQLTLSDLSSV